MRGAGWGGALLLAVIATVGAPGSTAAQTSGPPAPGQESADSTQLRIFDRLRRLDRRPGSDSVLYVQDSLRTAAGLEGRRPQASGPDSVRGQLLGMPGFVLTEYESGSADFATKERVLELQAPEGGRARVSREGIEVQADTAILFNQDEGLLRTIGVATFTPPEGDPVESANMVYDLSQGRGSATDARTEFTQGGARWHVRGDMPYAAQDSSYMSHAQFTSCDLEVPHYHFETDQIKIVGGRVLIARGVRLYFADVPVAWLPFIAQSLSQGRSSGLLTPRFSVNDVVRNSTGYRRRVSNIGFYWAMSDYSDAIVAMDWFSDNYFSLTSSLQYRFSKQFLNGSLDLRRYWQASGSTQLSLTTAHAWDVDERTQLRVSGRFTSSNDFVRDYSFNPAEVTQSIDSDASVGRRFGWGSLTVGASRKQYLSDDRTEWTLPSASLSLTPITLFRAPSSEAHPWNNMTWQGFSSFTRSTVDRMRPDTFSISQAGTATRAGSARSSINIGRISFAQSVSARESKTLDVPEAYLILGDSAAGADLLVTAPARDVAEASVNWTTSLDYQQQLVGSTTLTPRLSVSSDLLRSDRIAEASRFVSKPVQISLGATLKTDFYGFYPGFGPFEAMRHKVSPSFEYQWSPAKQPSDLQRTVFGSRALQPRNAVSVTLNQTWEARRRADETAAAPPADSLVALDAAGGRDTTTPGGPRRMEQAQTALLLGLSTSVVRYDFVEADSAGFFLAGFTSTRLQNTITSDYLRGLSVSMSHELFDDSESEAGLSRRFAPHLASLNFGFSLGSNSSIFRLLGLSGGGGAEEQPDVEEDAFTPLELDPLALDGSTDEASILPTRATGGAGALTPGGRRAGSGGWNANLSYSLQRPRGSLTPSQMLSGSLTLRPTENWDLTWRTAYDMERGAFNDHVIRLSRDLHRWQAHFDFLQTATGNWSFRFDVSLLDNRDLKFDYQQRNLDVGLPAGR